MKPTLNSVQRRFLKVEHGLAKGVRTLDVGCNAGDLMAALEERGCEAWGVDISENGVKFAKKYFGLQHAYAISSEDFFRLSDLPQFDVITLFEIVEHVEDPEGLVRGAAKLLKPGGTLVLSTPSRERFFVTSISSDPPPGHLTRWNEAAIINLFRGTGCKFEKSDYVDEMRLLVYAFAEKFAMGLVKKTAKTFKDKKIDEEDATAVGGNAITKAVHIAAYIKNYAIGGIPAGICFLFGKLTGRKNGDMIIWLKKSSASPDAV